MKYEHKTEIFCFMITIINALEIFQKDELFKKKKSYQIRCREAIIRD